MARRAAFLDRDGTIIEDVSFIGRPDQVQLRPTAAEAIALLNEHDVAVVVITNQSGIARGMFSVADYEAVRDRVAEVLAEHGAHIDASYYCPHHPASPARASAASRRRKFFDEAIAELEHRRRRSMFARRSCFAMCCPPAHMAELPSSSRASSTPAPRSGGSSAGGRNGRRDRCSTPCSNFSRRRARVCARPVASAA